MSAKFKFLLLYFLSWIIFFDLMRLVFLLYHWDKTRLLTLNTALASFRYGFRMDASVAAYILIPVCLFVILSLFLHFFRRLLPYKIYTLLVLLIVSLISLADLELYNAWGFRIDASPLKFLATPREAFASISHLPLFWILLLFAIAYGLFYFCFNYILKRIFFQQQHKYRLLTAIAIIAFTGLLIIPIRGGLQLAPLNQSTVYYSTNNYANHSAINASWNFLHSLVSKHSTNKNPYQYMTADHASTIRDSLYRHGLQTQQVVNFTSTTNIMVIIWESFTEKALHVNINGQPVLPQFKRLAREGIFFSNVYASGDRTNKGIPAILSGYPAMPNTTIIHFPAKSSKLRVLPQLFKERGYQAPFFYGGEPEFANIKSYLLHAGFDPIVGRDDFSKRDMNSKWGAHDGVVMNRVLTDLNNIKKPFFATWLTLSSHEPFETPVATVFPGSDYETKFMNSLHYTDEVLGQFIDSCQKQDWWANTVVIIIGDHGHPLPATPHRADNFRTPMLWLGGALSQRGISIDRVTSQLDIPAMLLGQAGWKNEYFPFSKNSLDSTVSPWAFFTFNDGFGFVNDKGKIVYDNVGKISIDQEGQAGNSEKQAGQALQQITFEDYIRK